MDRLTFDGNFCDISMCRENPCPYNGMCSQRQTWERLKEYEDAEQDGRLVMLPSKTVWELTMDAGPDCDMKCPVDAWDESLGCDLCSKAKQFAYERPCTQERLKELGKTVFLTREEAEAALKGGEG